MKFIWFFCFFALFTQSYSEAATYSVKNPQRIEDQVFGAEDQVLLRAASISLVRTLLAHGISHVGAFNLAAFATEVDQVTYAAVTMGLPVAQGRLGHLYDVPSKRVRLNADFFHDEVGSTAYSRATAIVLLHETLGALGYFDEDYELSAPIASLVRLLTLKDHNLRTGFDDQKRLTNIEIRQFSTQFQLNIKRRIANPTAEENLRHFGQTRLALAAGGGTSEGGGGGDPISALAKTMMLEQLMRQRLSSAFLNFANLNTNFETYQNDDVSCPQSNRKEFEDDVRISVVGDRTHFSFPVSCASNLVQNSFQYWFVDGFIDTLREQFEVIKP